MEVSKLEQYHKDGLLIKQTHPTKDLTIWNYTQKVQYERLWDDITIQCRGLVTNSVGDIIATPFPKFFNIEEHDINEIPNEPFEVFEKMDGSLGIIFYYGGDWVVASRGSFTSEQSVKASEMFNNLSINEEYPTDGINRLWTYLFEIIYKENKIICDYDFDGLVLLGAYHTDTKEEIEFEKLRNHVNLHIKVKTVRKYSGVTNYKSLKEKIGNNREGYVVRFKNGFRVKIKGDEYSRLHKLITNISNRDIWEYLKENKSLDEIIERVPDEFHDWVKQTKGDLITNFNMLEREYNWIFKTITRIKGTLERKVFAQYVKEYKHPSILFLMYDKKDCKQKIWKLIYPRYRKPFKNEN